MNTEATPEEGVPRHISRIGLGTLTLNRTTDRYAVYSTALTVYPGADIYIARDDGRELVDLDDLDLREEWNRWLNAYPNRYAWTPSTQYGFRASIAERIIDPDALDEFSFCADCYNPALADEIHLTGHDTRVCDGCWENYYPCQGCGASFRSTTSTLNGFEMCQGCIERGYSYCESCDGWYPDEWADQHQHGAPCGGNCEAPAQVFSVRNDGAEPLPNDTRLTVSLPSGVISDVGMEEIRELLLQQGNSTFYATPEHIRHTTASTHHAWWGLARSFDKKLGPEWQTKRGNFTKRLSRLAYENHELKVPPEVLSGIGNIARVHSSGTDYAVEFTRNLNLSREQFFHGGSCWWSEYGESRCALKTNGGLGLRSFSSTGGVSGRAWVMPLKWVADDAYTKGGILTPTFETLSPDAFVVFNGYGELEGYAPARIVAHMAGMTYRKISFECSPMYVNNEAGYLVADEEIATRYADSGLCLGVAQHADLYQTEQDAKEAATEKEISHV